MKKAWWIAIVPGMLALAATAFVLVLLLVKVMWAWTVPDLFPGAVKLGLVAGEISWLAALKVALFAAVLAGMAGGRRSG
ncbi:MAG TPA: hypothetical protein VMY87_10570 [Armatimonadota bacterium]|nr:hypothetical protein [Armatimonadota bacterium]